MTREINEDTYIAYTKETDWDRTEGYTYSYDVHCVRMGTEDLTELYKENVTFAEAIQELIVLKEELNEYE